MEITGLDEVRRLLTEIVGSEKAAALMLAGMESVTQVTDALKHENRRLRAEVARAVADYEACEGENDRYLAEVRRAGDTAAALRAALAAKDAALAALAERLAAASEVLSRAAERRPDLFPETPT